MKSNIMENDLPFHSSLISSEIKQDLQAPLIASAALANDLFIQRWIENGEADRIFISRYLESVRGQHRTTTCFLLSERSRTYYNPNGAFPVNTDDPDAEWYFTFLEKDEKRQININLNVDMNNIPTVFINNRIIGSTGETLGVTGIGLELISIPHLLSKYGRDHERDIYFIGPEGEIIASSNEPAISNEGLLQKLRELPLKQGNSNDSILECNIEGEDLFLHRKYLPELDWQLVSIQHRTVAMKRMTRLLFTLVIFHIISIILTLSAVFVSVRYYQNRLKKMATTDALTGVSNRQVFEYSLSQALNRYERKQTPASLLLIDIDFFKSINDRYGHIKGDQVLKETASLISSQIRKADELCRWGGEEFVVLSFNCTLDKALILAEKIRVSIEQACIISYPEGGALTVSIGVSGFKAGDTNDALLQRADEALYSAKKSDRNCVRS